MKISDITVMICDDSPLVIKKTGDILRKIGVAKTIHASDGEEAVEQYKASKPNLVFMDIVMPKKTGLEALREIRSFDPNARVVMASTIGTQSNLISAIKEGAFEFLQKPIKEDDILKVVNRMLKE
ncbi:MAG: response regulator [Ruminiclostridium sp.]|nr:response regulator [Ruminiclostridium sp.]